MDKGMLYSYHVFLFPFQWVYTGTKYDDQIIEEKNKLNFFCDRLNENNWKRRKLQLNTILEYNEYNYFYDFVRDILYDKEFPARTEKQIDRSEESFLAHFEYDVPPDTLSYIIEISDRTEPYKLLIDSIILHLYNTGVGVLSFHLHNRDKEQSSPEDILRINQFGRRTYPPFFKVRPEWIGTQDQFRKGSFAEGLQGVKTLELPSKITISGFPAEDFSAYASKLDFQDGIFVLPAFIHKLFGTTPVITALTKDNSNITQILIAPVLDDRMFVVSWYGNADLVKEISKDFNALRRADGEFSYLNMKDDWLYKYIFIDVNLTCQNEEMVRDLLKQHINARWVNYGTLFAATRYSFVCLTQPLTDANFRNYSGFLVNHIQTMYYKMAELCLVQRACIMRFSDEVSEISAMNSSNRRNLEKKVSSLYKQYIRFVNRIYFREITAQDQGIEIYDLLQNKMRLRDHVKDLDTEIEELHNYLKMEEQAEQNKEMTLLTKVACIFLPASLIAGIFGMNTIDSTMFSMLSTIGLVVLGLLIGSAIAHFRIFNILRRK